MSRATVIARGRAAAEAGMVDTCIIRRPGVDVTDPFTGEVTPQLTDVYQGKCRIQQRRSQAREEDAGEAYILVQAVELQLPVSLTGLQVDDQVTVTASRDPDLVGRLFRVHDLAYKTDATARRPQVEEITS
jgi:hypothetical protein